MSRKERRRQQKLAKRPAAGRGGGDPRASFDLAVHHHQAGRLHEAERIYRRILRAQPDHPDALHLLGLVAHQTGESEAAVELITKAIAHNPGQPAYFSNLGNALKQQGKRDDAIAAYEQALAIDPDLAEVHSNLGNALKDGGRLEEAIAAYRRALALNPALAEVHSNLGSALHDLGRIEDAVACYRRALEINPAYAEAYSNYGNALQDQGKLDEAVAAYRRALALNPELPETHGNLGNALQELGQLSGAIAAYRAALAAKPDDANLEMNLRRALSRRVPPWHFPMLADASRNEAYERAIAKAVDGSSRVLDIGTGSGLLALMAARAGAAHVTACEVSQPLAETARQIVADNGYADRITVIGKKSTRLRIGVDMAERANVLISEILDIGLIGEGVLPTLRHALQDLVTPDAKVIPRAAQIFGALVALPRLRTVNPISNVSGFDLSAFDRFRSPYEYKAVDLEYEEHQQLSEVFSGPTFDFRAPPPCLPNSQPHEVVLDVEAIADGTAHAVAFWFELKLDDAITLSTGPGGGLFHWRQAVQFFDDDVPVEQGDRVQIRLCYSDLGIRFTT